MNRFSVVNPQTRSARKNKRDHHAKETEMNDTIAHRLALLDGAEFSPADLESIAAEVEDLERVVAELEKFAQDTPWISLQAQPPGKKV
jgi:phosphate uptake regulator